MALEGLKRRILGSVGLLKGKRTLDEEEVKELNAQAIATMAVLFGAPALLFAYLTLAN